MEEEYEVKMKVMQSVDGPMITDVGTIEKDEDPF
jgi:hypothetical protein